jgi:hypothetical protein
MRLVGGELGVEGPVWQRWSVGPRVLLVGTIGWAWLVRSR